MSRCFAYPRPGYVLPENKGALIKPIKLQKDKEKAKEERRKEKKREKDRKRKREVQSGVTVGRFGQEKLVNEKSWKVEKQTSSLKGNYAKIRGDDVSSDVTEEHEQPVCVAKPSYSSEDSQNSDKKRQHELPTNTIHRSGSILKIRLSSLKKKEHNVDSVSGLPSTSGRTDPVGQSDIGFGQRLVEGQSCCNSIGADFRVSVLSPEKQPSLLEAQIPNHAVAVSKSSTTKASKVELLYKSLLEGWVSPNLGSEQGYDDDEQDWLFQRKFRNTERSETSSNARHSLNSNLWPRAQFLPLVDVYALPYTVPF